MTLKTKTIRLLTVVFVSVLTLSCGSGRKLPTRPPGIASSFTAQKLGFKASHKGDKKLYDEAAAWLGVPYKYGGNTKAGVDCSGMTVAIYRRVYGITLARTVAEMYRKNCRKISRSQLRPGDLVFFNTAKTKASISHVGIFLKDNVFIHATTQSGVRLSTLDEAYYKQRWISGGRVR